MKIKQAFFVIIYYLLSFVELTGQFSTVQIETDKIVLSVRDTNFDNISFCSDIGTCRMTSNGAGEKNIIIDNLRPATKVSLCIQKEQKGEVQEVEKYFMTRSQSTGQIKVYFNRAVDTSYMKDSNKADGTDFGILQAALRNLIRGAQQTIDVAAYNVNELFFVNELIDASSRGVRVRFITDDETSNTGLAGGVPFPVVRGNTGSGLMHNKFLIIDEDSVNDSWVVTGSMNFTTNQMRRDPNHLIFIQDQSLARAYVMEFEEMWGGKDALPNLLNARFGNQKTQNTPTHFVIGDVPTEVYFSPSDKTTAKIADVLNTRHETLLLALMIFTNWDLRDVVVRKTTEGMQTRWIVDDTENSGQVMSALQSAGGQVLVHSHPDLFHHKYAIADEDTENAVLITGSHNWTFSAETRNDENTLILYDKKLANIFRQEFEARWKELTSSAQYEELEDLSIFPNPAEGVIRFSREVDGVVIQDLQGQILLRFPGKTSFIHTDLPSGMYLCFTGNDVKKIIIQR